MAGEVEVSGRLGLLGLVVRPACRWFAVCWFWVVWYRLLDNTPLGHYNHTYRQGGQLVRPARKAFTSPVVAFLYIPMMGKVNRG